MKYARIDADAYHTIDNRAVRALQSVFSLNKKRLLEPCAGKGHMMWHLENLGVDITMFASDLHSYEGQDPRVMTPVDLFSLPSLDAYGIDGIITNPPYSNKEEVIRHFLNICDGWVILLLDAKFLSASKRRDLYEHERFFMMAPLPFRLKWFDESTMTGTKDHAWFIWRPLLGHDEYQYARLFKPPVIRVPHI